MNIIQGLTDEPNQKMTLSIDGGTLATLVIYYREQQQGWFYDLTWNGTFILNGRQLCVSPNILRQFRTQIPFGIAVATPNNQEPIAQTGFADGTATLLLLNAADVASLEASLFPGL